MGGSKRLERLMRRGQTHGRRDDADPSERNGVVVFARRLVMSGVPLDAARKIFARQGGIVPPQISPRQPDVVPMMKIRVVDAELFHGLDELIIGKLGGQHMPL